MNYVRKLFTLPDTVAERLSAERNQSATVAEALEFFWDTRAAGKRIVSLAERLERRLDEKPAAKPQGRYKYDYTNKQYWDSENETYVPHIPE